MNTPLKTKYFFVIAASVILAACTGEKPDENEDDISHTPTEVIDNASISAQNVFNSIPARVEIIKLIAESKIDYNADYLSNPDNASKFSLENSRALNLGVYGADLSVAGAFDQTQESMLFLKCVNILAKNLGVNTAFDQRMMDRMEASKENRDSTLEIIAQSFKKCDDYLKQNGRPGTSSLILAGSWIEGMYISCEIAKSINAESSSENIIKTILKQDESLKHLINMVEASKLGEDAAYVLKDLKDIQISLDDARKNTVCNLETIKYVSEKIAALRKKVIDTF